MASTKKKVISMINMMIWISILIIYGMTSKPTHFVGDEVSIDRSAIKDLVVPVMSTVKKPVIKYVGISEMIDSYIENRKEKIFPTEDLSADIQWMMADICNEWGIPLEIMMALSKKESTYTSGLISDDGHDYGICQIRDVNHLRIANALGRTMDYYNDHDSIEAACYMLKELRQKYPNDGWRWILLCYNGGEAYALEKAGDNIYTSYYAETVISYAKELGWDEN